MKKLWVLSIIAAVLWTAGCASAPKDTVMQMSTIDALLAGHYDGHIPCRKLLQYGDHGLGTFDRLEGEMIVMDGNLYQVKADGHVYRPSMDNRTPFAAVCRFQPEETWALDHSLNFDELEAWLDARMPNKNIFCAIRIDGTFSYMKTRSVPMQSKPYPPLAEIAKTQPQFEMRNIRGSIVGFRCPPFVKGINVPGYHLHFLSEDRTKGGHILSFELEDGICAVDRCREFYLRLPKDDQALAETDLSIDRSRELKDVER